MTDPKNFELVGVPPADLIEEVVAAWNAAGLDGVAILRQNTDITQQFVYEEKHRGNIRDRIKPKSISTKLIPVKNRTLAEAPWQKYAHASSHSLPLNGCTAFARPRYLIRSRNALKS